MHLFIQDGMQREIFLKLLAKLEEHCKNVLIGSEIDYRRLIAQRSIDQVRSKPVIILSPLAHTFYAQVEEPDLYIRRVQKYIWTILY